MSAAELAELDARVLLYVQTHQGAIARDIAAAVLHCTGAPRTPQRSRIAKVLERLEARSALRHEGDGRGQTPRRWYSTPTDQELEEREADDGGCPDLGRPHWGGGA